LIEFDGGFSIAFPAEAIPDALQASTARNFAVAPLAALTALEIH